MIVQRNSRYHRPTALLVTASLISPVLLLGCGGSPPSGANLPPVDDTRSGSAAQVAPPGQNAPRTGMSTKQKVVLLAGAAALYYMWKKSQSRKAETGAEGKYYLSKNGRVYYRDAQGRAHWVTPPPGGIQVDPNELNRYPELKDYRGYDSQNTGRDFGGLMQGS